jgi:hypothetical protein
VAPGAEIDALITRRQVIYEKPGGGRRHSCSPGAPAPPSGKSTARAALPNEGFVPKGSYAETNTISNGRLPSPTVEQGHGKRRPTGLNRPTEGWAVILPAHGNDTVSGNDSRTVPRLYAEARTDSGPSGIREGTAASRTHESRYVTLDANLPRVTPSNSLS